MISIENLKISFCDGDKTVVPIKNLDLEIFDGEILGLVGKSGCGKSVLSSACLGMVEYPGVIENGNILFNINHKSIDITAINEKQWYSIRGKDISMIFQNSIAALNPARTIGSQFVEAIKVHNININKKEALNIARKKLAEVMLPESERILGAYPL